MKVTPLRHVVLAGAIALSFLTPPATGLARDAKQIGGTFKGQSIVTQIGPTTFRQENSATGTLSHVGRVTAHWVVREVSFDAATHSLVVSQPEWIGTLRAQNGDEISGVYTFRSTTLPISPSGDVTFITDLRITGGTGRFAGATGEAVAIGRANIWTAKFTIDLTGTITR